MLITVGIVSALAGIAVPVMLSQRSNVGNTAARTALISMQSTVETAALTAGGMKTFTQGSPLNICHDTLSDWPDTSGSPAANTCEPGMWTATSLDRIVVDELHGTLPENVTTQGRIAGDGSYCFTATADTGTPWQVTSTNPEPAVGSCAGWVPSGSLVGSTGQPATLDTGLVSEVSNVTAGHVDGVVTVSWDAEANRVYLVRVSGSTEHEITATANGPLSCVFPAETCEGPATGSLPAGTYAVTVRTKDVTSGQVSGATTTTVTIPVGETGNPGEGDTSGNLAVFSVVNMAGQSVNASVATTRRNVIANPSAETNVAGWSSGGTANALVSRSNDVAAVTGKYVANVTAYHDGTSRVTVNQTDGDPVPVTALRAYVFSAYVKAATGQPGAPVTLHVDWLNTSGTAIATTASTPVDDSAATWTRIGLPAVAPAGTAAARLIITWGGQTENDTHYVDGALFEEGTIVAAYFDGDTNNAAWTADKHASPSILNLTADARGRAKVTWTTPTIAGSKSVTYLVTSNPDEHTCAITSATACYVTGLDDDTTYTFTVRATTPAGTGTPATSGPIRTPVAPALAPTPPSKPMGLTTTITGPPGSVKLSWQASTTAGSGALKRFIIERTSGALAWTTLDNSTTPTATTFTDTGLNEGQNYLYRVSAENSSGVGPASDTVIGQASAAPTTPTVTDQPHYLLSSGNVEMRVTINALNTETLTTGYSTNANLTTSNQLAPSTAATVDCTGATCRLVWPNFTNKLGTAYTFYIFAVNTIGESNARAVTPAAPDRTVITTATAGTTAYCPTTHPIDVAPTWCRVTQAYTYYWVDGPCTGWTEAQYGGWWVCSSRGPGHSERNATPTGWLDDGTQWYQDVPKIIINTYQIAAAGGWNDTTSETKRVGKITINDTTLTNGLSADLGRCPGTITYELLGIGGKTTGTHTLPCN